MTISEFNCSSHGQRRASPGSGHNHCRACVAYTFLRREFAKFVGIAGEVVDKPCGSSASLFDPSARLPGFSTLRIRDLMPLPRHTRNIAPPHGSSSLIDMVTSSPNLFKICMRPLVGFQLPSILTNRWQSRLYYCQLASSMCACTSALVWRLSNSTSAVSLVFFNSLEPSAC